MATLTTDTVLQDTALFDIVFFIDDARGIPFEEAEMALMDNAPSVFLTGARIGGGIILRNPDSGEQVVVEDLLEQVAHRLCVDGAAKLLRSESFSYSYATSAEMLEFAVADGNASVERGTFFPIAAPVAVFAASLLTCADRIAAFLHQVAVLDPVYAKNAAHLEQRVAEARAASGKA